jgi:hypothetical protein
VTRYGLSGRFETSFGALLEADNEVEQRATNRVHLALRENGELWVAFLHHLVVRRYSHRGELQAEFDLAAKLAEQKVEVSREPPAVNIDGVQLPVLIQDITTAKGSGQEDTDSLWLLLGDGHLLQLSSSGEIRFTGRLRGDVHWGHLAARAVPRPGLLLGEFRGRKTAEVDFERLGKRLTRAEKGVNR